MRHRLLLFVVPLVVALSPSVADAHTPVFWDNCQGLQQQSTLLGRPASSARAHFCSVRAQLAPQDKSDFQMLRRNGDAELILLDDANASFSSEFPTGTLHSIGDSSTHTIGSNAFGTIWRATGYVYVQFGDYCVFHADVEPNMFDGVPGWDVFNRSHTCT